MGVRLIVAAMASAPAGSALAASPAQDYMLFCMGCHGEQAQGIPGRVPPLAHSMARFMRTAEGRRFLLRVPGVASSALPDDRIAAVLNWLAKEYDAEDLHRSMALFTTEEVAAARRVPLADVPAARRQVISQLAETGAAPPSSY
jgi:cytochrome c553